MAATWPAQLVARLVDLLRHFRLARFDDAFALLVRGAPRFLDDAAGARLRLVEDLARLAARLFHHRLDLAPGFLERACALVGGRETVGDLLLALVDRIQDVAAR